MKPINLQLGWPSTSLLPKAELISATKDVLNNHNPESDETLCYGPDPGSETVREQTADWLSKFYRPTSGPIDSKRIFIGNGASASLGIILEKFTDPIYTRRIWMIEPTYFLACPIFEDAGFEGRLRGVPEDDQGIDIDFLRAALDSADDEATRLKTYNIQSFKSTKKYPKLYRHVIYVVPTFSNPSGRIMSLERRRELVQLARKYDALLVADDVYDMLQWPADPDVIAKGPHTASVSTPSPPPRLVDIDRTMSGCSQYGNACSNGSFSKIVAPGVRCSWIEATESFTFGLSTHGATKSGGCPSQMTSNIIRCMVGSGLLQAHLDDVVLPVYRNRYKTMIRAIETHLEPLGVRRLGSTSKQQAGPRDGEQEQQQQAGGFFCYIMFPDDMPPANEIASIALEYYALKIAFGQMMVVAGDESSAERCDKTFGRGARLSWSWCSDDEIKEGVERLAMVLRDIRSDTVGNGYVTVNKVGLDLN